MSQKRAEEYSGSMSRICFVTNEIHPTKPGGAAFLLYNLAQALLLDGHEVIFLVDISEEEFHRFNTHDRLEYPRSENCRAYHVGTLCAGIPYREKDFLSRYLWESYTLEYACRHVYQQENPDLIEFLDFCGPAYCALSAKVANISYQNTRLAVRMHGPISTIDRASPVKPLDYDRLMIYALEERAFRLAETVLIPAPSVIDASDGLNPHTWYGEKVFSPPLLAPVGQGDLPYRDRVDPDANIILFYGRLYAIKGVDLFVDAALEWINQHPESHWMFYLVGSESKEPPDPKFSSYQQFLLKKIPQKYHDRFIFTGFLLHRQLQDLLPRVKFAVFPSYYETFCYAAQELRFAGIPLIVSDIPAYRDTFNPGTDALFFNGSLSDLIQKIYCLSADAALLDILSRPFAQKLKGDPSYYRSIPRESWMNSTKETARPELVVGILDEGQVKDGLQATLSSLQNSGLKTHFTYLFKKAGAEQSQERLAWFCGGWYSIKDPEGRAVPVSQVLTKDALLLLRAGDRVSADYIPRALDILSHQPKIAYVGSWKWIHAGMREWLQTHPFDAMAELAPFETQSYLNRCIMRTKPGISLIDLFDRRAGTLAEIDYLWQLERQECSGLWIPEPLIRIMPDRFAEDSSTELSYLTLKYGDAKSNARLVQYLTMLVNGYPAPYLPLQTAWLRNGLGRPRFKSRTKHRIFSNQGMRSKVARRLSQSGKMGRAILKFWREFKAKRRKY
jgi:glycosyltransferase involved in cell wall biosynthesis